MRFLLDTCVISEMVKPHPDRHVQKWILNQEEENLYLSVLTLGEIQKGISRLEDVLKKKAELTRWLNDDLTARFQNRILAFTLDVALVWGGMMGEAERQGRKLPVLDCMIAATALHHGMAVVTRNTEDMVRCGVSVTNPLRNA